MRRRIAAVAAALAMSLAVAAAADQRVRGHFKDTDRDGIKDTYVNPYFRSESNSTTSDNYSTRGNTNPYTGQQGTVPDSGSGYGSFGNSGSFGYGSQGSDNSNSYGSGGYRSKSRY